MCSLGGAPIDNCAVVGGSPMTRPVPLAPEAPCPAPSGITARTYRTAVGSQTVDLPLVQVAPGITIALLICVDHGVAFSETAGKELAEKLRDARPEVVVSVATMGIPLAIEVSRALELDDYVILHKTPKIHLGDGWAEPVRSITTGSDQTLRLDPARVAAVRGRRVAIVDDVVSTGASLRAALNLLRRADAEPVVVGAFLTEGDQWRRALGADAELVRALGTIPLFRDGPDGGLVEDWLGDA
jgi:adenine/guanine phosphoribosyltransferase-like PRPP-binding protein